MNWQLIIGFAVFGLIVGLAYVMKGAFIRVAGLLLVAGIFGGIIYLAYRWLFPPGWKG